MDVERLRQQVPELSTVSPMLSHWGAQTVFKDKKSNCNVKGLMPDYQNVEVPKLLYGRYINDMDITRTHFLCCIL